MTRHTPIFATERTAAQLFDMTPAEFMSLVNLGHLPKPRDIGGVQRWDVAELTRIAKGEAIHGGSMSW